jgi:hypothetical protein
MDTGVSARDLIKSETDFWEGKFPGFKTFFGSAGIKGLILSCEAVMQNNPSKEKLIPDFIYGLVLLRINLKFKDEEHNRVVDELLKPVTDLIIKVVKSADYRQHLINKEVTGDEILKINNVSIPITAKEILLHIGRTDALPLTSKDIAVIQSDFVKYKENQFKRKGKIKPPKYKKTFQEYFDHEKNDKLVSALKKAFEKESKEMLAVLVHVLRVEFKGVHKSGLLIISTKELMDFHAAMAEYFSNTDIGARQLYSHYPEYFKEKKYSDQITVCISRINKILQSIDK